MEPRTDMEQFVICQQPVTEPPKLKISFLAATYIIHRAAVSFCNSVIDYRCMTYLLTYLQSRIHCFMT